jgi:hypothetical protein
VTHYIGAADLHDQVIDSILLKTDEVDAGTGELRH